MYILAGCHQAKPSVRRLGSSETSTYVRSVEDVTKGMEWWFWGVVARQRPQGSGMKWGETLNWQWIDKNTLRSRRKSTFKRPDYRFTVFTYGRFVYNYEVETYAIRTDREVADGSKCETDEFSWMKTARRALTIHRNTMKPVNQSVMGMTGLFKFINLSDLTRKLSWKTEKLVGQPCIVQPCSSAKYSEMLRFSKWKIVWIMNAAGSEPNEISAGHNIKWRKLIW
jgi:hypothetical protein